MQSEPCKLLALYHRMCRLPPIFSTTAPHHEHGIVSPLAAIGIRLAPLTAAGMPNGEFRIHARPSRAKHGCAAQLGPGRGA
jgi:hypothetical protein